VAVEAAQEEEAFRENVDTTLMKINRVSGSLEILL